MRDLYIYYQVRDADSGALLARVQAIQASLAARHGVAVGLKRRPQSKDGMQTWMEIYTATGDGFDAALDAALQEAGVSAMINGERHTEVFMDLNLCA